MTSRELYNKIRWDQRIDSSKVTVGYEDRFRGVLELPFSDPKLGNDVPWHRVVNFRYAQAIIWDRQGLENFELLTTKAAPSGVTCFEWNDHEQIWTDTEAGIQVWHSGIKLLTWNVLFDLYDGRVPRIQQRFPGIIEELQKINADIVALQEVTPTLAQLLLQDQWIRSQYFCSTKTPESVLSPYGPLLLSKIPGEFQHRSLRAGKTVVSGVIHFAGAPVHLINLHLYSNRKAQAEELRQRQLAEALAYVDKQSNCWLMGDFNLIKSLNIEGFQDIWESLEPELHGHSYIPVANPLATLTSTTKRAARFDRILVRGDWAPLATRLTRLTEPLSDHYPLEATLTPPLEAGPSSHSALVVIPPKEHFPEIQAVRQKHDKSYGRWMPHINLLYGFVPEESFDEAVQRLRPLVERLPRFRIRLREYRRFEHPQSTSIWLKPECTPQASLLELQKALESLFPNCQEQSSHSSEGFTPHLTLASIPNAKACPQLPKLDICFEVDALHLISRDAATPFEVKETLPLGELPLEACLPPRKDCSSIQTRVERLCRKAGGRALAVGSQALNLNFPWSDLDFVVLAPTRAEDFFAHFPGGRPVSGRVPLWRMILGGVKVDLQFAYCPADINLEDLSPETLRQLVESEHSRAVRSKLELDTLLARYPLEGYQDLLRAIRLWTHRRCLDNPAFGFPGGWAWALWVLDFAEKFQTPELTSFYSWLGDELEANSPISLLTDPTHKLWSNTSSTSRDSLLTEINRAEYLSQQERWGALTNEFSPDQILTLNFDGGGPDAFEERFGWLSQKILALVVDCEKQEKSRLRPFSLEQNGQDIELRFEETGQSSERAIQSFLKNWEDRFPSERKASWERESSAD